MRYLNRINASIGFDFGLETRLNITSLFPGDPLGVADNGRPITFGHQMLPLLVELAKRRLLFGVSPHQLDRLRAEVPGQPAEQG